MSAGAGPRDHAGRASGTFDVFLSYNRADQETVEEIAHALTRAGFSPWLDRWHLAAGASWQRELGAALSACRSCAVFVGAADLGDWEHQEVEVALDRAAKDPGFRVFLVLLPGVPDPFDAGELSPFLSTRTWVDLRGGIHAPAALRQLENAVRGIPPGATDAVEPLPVCPYRGLETFDEEHADFFFGREAAVQRALEKLKSARFLAVVGASGSGKSSLVRAGVIPALRAGRIEGSEDWQIRVLVPGAHPLTTLAAHLTRLDSNGAMARTLDELGRDQRTLHLAAAAALVDRPSGDRIVWVVDQGEEIFTLCRDEHERSQFLANLLYAASAPDGRTSVIVTLRADFYARLAAYPEVAQAVASHQLLVGPMDADDLRRVIEEPARRVGLPIEPGLVGTILDDVAQSPGALPLLEHALLELWNRGAGRGLTLEDYRASGGVDGALSQAADDVYVSFTPPQQEIARRTLLRLTQPGEGTEDTRRRAALDELGGTGADADVDAVVTALIAARLLTTSTEPETGTSWLDVSHEALIRGWPRLRAWIDDDRAGLRVHRRITEAAAEWETLGHDSGALFRGARLIEAKEFAARPTADLNAEERAFVDASISARRREERRRRLRFAAVVGAVALVAIGATIAAARLRAERNSAEAAKKQAQSRELAAASGTVLTSDPTLGLALAKHAYDRADTAEAAAALRTALVEDHERLVLGHDRPVDSAVYSQDAKRIATTDGGRITVWDAASGRAVSRFAPRVGRSISSTTFQPDGQRLLVVSFGGAAELWDVDRRTMVTHMAEREPGGASAATVDGRYVLMNMPRDDRVRVWDADLGKPVARLSVRSFVFGEFSADGRVVFMYDGKKYVSFDWRRGKRIGRLRDVGGPESLSPDGRYVTMKTGALPSTTTLAIWDLRTRRRVAAMRGPSTSAFTPDSRFVFVAHDDEPADVISLPDGKRVEPSYRPLEAHTGSDIDPRGRFRSGRFGPELVDALTGRQAVRYGASGAASVAGFSPDGERALVIDGPLVRVEAVPPTTATKLTRSVRFADELGLDALMSGTDNAITLVGWDTGRLQETWAEFDAEGLRQHRSAQAVRMVPRAIGVSADGRAIVVDGRRLTIRTPPGFAPGRAVTLEGAVPAIGIGYGDTNKQIPGRAFLSGDGRRLVAGVDDGARVNTWDTTTGSSIATTPKRFGIPRSASPDARTAVVGATGFEDDGQVPAGVVDAAAGEPVTPLRPEVGSLFTSAFSPSGDRFATVEKAVGSLWSRSGRLVATLAAAGGGSRGPVAFSPGGGYLATVDNSANLQIWRGSDGVHIGTLASSVTDVLNITWLGSRVAVLHTSGMLTLFPCEVCQPTPTLRQLTDQRAARDLSDAEKKKYLHES